MRLFTTIEHNQQLNNFNNTHKENPYIVGREDKM